MKKVQLASFLLLVLTLLVMAVNRFAAVLPDWAVRTVGVMLLSLPAASCCVVKGCMKKQIKTGERGGGAPGAPEILLLFSFFFQKII